MSINHNQYCFVRFDYLEEKACLVLLYHAKHARPRKFRVVNNFLFVNNFYSVILKLGTKKELAIL